MLVLNRKPGESVVIDGGRIIVKVLEPDYDPRFRRGARLVRLGITAPPEVSVDREEIHLQKNPHAAPRRPTHQ